MRIIVPLHDFAKTVRKGVNWDFNFSIRKEDFNDILCNNLFLTK